MFKTLTKEIWGVFKMLTKDSKQTNRYRASFRFLIGFVMKLRYIVPCCIHAYAFALFSTQNTLYSIETE